MKLNKLEFNQKFLIKIRTGLSKITKFKVYRLGEFKDSIYKTSDRIKSISAIFKSPEHIDSLYKEAQNLSSRIDEGGDYGFKK